jgi:hypothetical protein
MFIEVVKAEYLDGYRLKLLFNNGERRVVDLGPSLNGSVFAPLKDTEAFKKFSIKFNTIEWENGADFAPEYLYEIGTMEEENIKDDVEGIEQFRKDIQTDLANGSIPLFGFSLPISDLTNGECNKITNTFNNSSLFYFARVYMGEKTIPIKKLKDDFQKFMETGHYKFN